MLRDTWNIFCSFIYACGVHIEKNLSICFFVAVCIKFNDHMETLKIMLNFIQYYLESCDTLHNTAEFNYMHIISWWKDNARKVNEQI